MEDRTNITSTQTNTKNSENEILERRRVRG